MDAGFNSPRTSDIKSCLLHENVKSAVLLFFLQMQPLQFAFRLVSAQMLTNPRTDSICFPVSASPSPQTAHAHDKWSPKTINNMKYFSPTWIVSSPFSRCFFLFLSSSCSLCWTCSLLCRWQALRSQDALRREPRRGQPVRLQTSAEEDLAETEAHQTVLNAALNFWVIWLHNLKHGTHYVAVCPAVWWRRFWSHLFPKPRKSTDCIKSHQSKVSKCSVDRMKVNVNNAPHFKLAVNECFIYVIFKLDITAATFAAANFVFL